MRLCYLCRFWDAPSFFVAARRAVIKIRSPLTVVSAKPFFRFPGLHYSSNFVRAVSSAFCTSGLYIVLVSGIAHAKFSRYTSLEPLIKCCTYLDSLLYPRLKESVELTN